MAALNPLTGIELIDCAKANALKGAMTAAERCGYGNDIAAFREALSHAGDDIGVDISELGDLVTARQTAQVDGDVVAPDTMGSL